MVHLRKSQLLNVLVLLLLISHGTLVFLFVRFFGIPGSQGISKSGIFLKDDNGCVRYDKKVIGEKEKAVHDVLGDERRPEGVPCNCSSNRQSLREETQPGLGEEFIFVYEISSKFNTELQSAWIRWWSEQYEPEYVLYDMFSKKNVSRTMDPEKASLFFIPFLSARYTLIEHKEETPEMLRTAVEKTSEAWREILNHIKSEFPFFNRTNGRNHFSVLTMDHGRCTAITFCDPSVYGEMFFFQLNADKMVRSIHTSTTRGLQALTYNYGMKMVSDLPDIPCYMPDRDIPIPPMSTVKNKTAPWASERPITALFRFAAGQHHGVPIPHFNHYIRKELLELYKDKGYTNWSIESKSEWDTRNDWKSAKFCICPPGHGQWTSRPSKSIMSGCIPITFMRDHDNPWKDEMDHSLYTVNVDPDHLHSVKMLIDSILSRPKLFQAMQRQLEKAQSAFDWSEEVENGAREHVIRALRRRAAALNGGGDSL